MGRAPGGHTVVRQRSICPAGSLPRCHGHGRRDAGLRAVNRLGCVCLYSACSADHRAKNQYRKSLDGLIPIVNIVLLLNIAKKPVWWIILFLIPLVNIVIAILVWMGVAEARNKPNWWGILMIIPVANLIVPGYLAWSD